MHQARAVAEQLAPAFVGGAARSRHPRRSAARRRNPRAGESRRAGPGAPRRYIASGWNGAPQAISRRCCASTSSPPGRGGSPSSSRAATPSMAASHSSTSKRLAGTSTAREGSSMPVIGAADALQQARDALRRADLDHLIDPAPVDAEIERGGRDHGAQPALRHRGFDAAALGDVEAAVVQADRQRLRVQPPQRLEQHLALRAGVDEHDGEVGDADAVEDFAAPRSAPSARPRAARRRAASPRATAARRPRPRSAHAAAAPSAET